MVVRSQQFIVLFSLVFGSTSFTTAQLSSHFACTSGNCATTPDHAVASVATYDDGSSWQWAATNHGAYQNGQVSATYNRYCVRCHGVDGRGVWDIPNVPDFSDPAWQSSRTDEQLARLTFEGRGAVMPAFRGTLTWNESWTLARYIRELAFRKPSRSHGDPTFQVPVQPQPMYVPQQTYVPAGTKFPTSHPTYTAPNLFTPAIGQPTMDVPHAVDTPTISSPALINEMPDSDFETPSDNDEPQTDDSAEADDSAGTDPAHGRDSEFSPPTEATQPPTEAMPPKTEMTDEPFAGVTDEQLDEYFDETHSGRSTEIPNQPIEELPAPVDIDESPKLPNLPNPSYDLQSPTLDLQPPASLQPPVSNLQSPVSNLQPPQESIQLQSYPIAGRYPAPPIRPRTVQAKPKGVAPAPYVPEYPNATPPGVFPPVKVNVTPMHR